MTDAELVSQFLEYMSVERGSSANTIAAYRRDLRQFLVFLSSAVGKSLVEASLADVERFTDHLRRQGLSDASIARRIAALRSFARYGYAEGCLSTDFARDVEPQRIPVRLPVVLSMAQVRKLLNSNRPASAVEIRNRTMLELLYSTGVRVSELVGLRVRDFDFDTRVVRCHGKGDKERFVPVGTPALRWVAAHLASMKSHGLTVSPDTFVFAGRSGRPLPRQEVWRIVRREARRSGIKSRVSPHTLRHSFATHMLAHDADLRVIQELLGHARITTTEIYTHLDREHLHRVYRRSHPRAVGAVENMDAQRAGERMVYHGDGTHGE